jgi:hypothetical protein
VRALVFACTFFLGLFSSFVTSDELRPRALHGVVLLEGFSTFLQYDSFFRDRYHLNTILNRAPASEKPLVNYKILYQSLLDVQSKDLLEAYQDDQAGLVQFGKDYLDSHTLHDHFDTYENVMNNLFTIAAKTRTPSLVVMLQDEVDHLATPENQKDSLQMPLILRWRAALKDCVGEGQ